MTLNEFQKTCKQDAELLGDYQLMTKTELANGYCDADEASVRAHEEGDTVSETMYEQIRSSYHSALLLRYWYKIFEWMRNSSSLNLEPVDFVSWLSHSLYVAFYYRVWRWEYEATVKEGKFIEWKLDENGNKIKNNYYYKVDPNAPDKIINRCCGSMRGRVYQYMNKDKRKADVQTFSIDQMLEDEGDAALNYNGCYENPKSMNGICLLVNELINRGEKFEALIIDGIANHDMEKVEKETKYMTSYNYETGQYEEVPYTQVHRYFDSRKLVKHLNSLDEEFVAKFCMMYDMNFEDAIQTISEIKKIPNAKLYKLIEKTKQEIVNNKDLLNCIA